MRLKPFLFIVYNYQRPKGRWNVFYNFKNDLFFYFCQSHSRNIPGFFLILLNLSPECRFCFSLNYYQRPKGRCYVLLGEIKTFHNPSLHILPRPGKRFPKNPIRFFPVIRISLPHYTLKEQ